VPVVGGTSKAREREAPKSLLEEELIEANANIRAQERVCSVSAAECNVLPRWIR